MAMQYKKNNQLFTLFRENILKASELGFVGLMGFLEIAFALL